MAPGASQTLNTSYRIDQDDVNAGEVVNVAIAAYTYAGQEHFIDDDVTVPGSRTPNLQITKVAAETSYSVINSLIHYTIVVTNTGNVTLSNVLIVDPVTGLNQTIQVWHRVSQLDILQLTGLPRVI